MRWEEAGNGGRGSSLGPWVVFTCQVRPTLQPPSPSLQEQTVRRPGAQGHVRHGEEPRQLLR